MSPKFSENLIGLKDKLNISKAYTRIVPCFGVFSDVDQLWKLNAWLPRCSRYLWSPHVVGFPFVQQHVATTCGGCCSRDRVIAHLTNLLHVVATRDLWSAFKHWDLKPETGSLETKTWNLETGLQIISPQSFYDINDILRFEDEG